jgi:hypothetical protein
LVNSELGAAWAVFVNFTGELMQPQRCILHYNGPTLTKSGAGFVALFTPLGIGWGAGKLLGLFSGFNAVGFILVSYFLAQIETSLTCQLGILIRAEH